ncbi:MAG TPA: hypothetical protein PLY09_04110 [Methanothrix sp.]|nr:hypothetical protein [Methanothrix sp.]HPJ83927.1 hypothetical protein [Methanothrix sp.]
MKIKPAPGELDVSGCTDSRSEDEGLRLRPITTVDGPQSRGPSPNLGAPGMGWQDCDQKNVENA